MDDLEEMFFGSAKPAEAAPQTSANVADARGFALVFGHTLFAVGMLVFYAVTAGGLLAMALFLMTFGVQVLVTQQFWKG